MRLETPAPASLRRPALLTNASSPLASFCRRQALPLLSPSQSRWLIGLSSLSLTLDGLTILLLVAKTRQLRTSPLLGLFLTITMAQLIVEASFMALAVDGLFVGFVDAATATAAHDPDDHQPLLGRSARIGCMYPVGVLFGLATKQFCFLAIGLVRLLMARQPIRLNPLISPLGIWSLAGCLGLFGLLSASAFMLVADGRICSMGLGFGLATNWTACLLLFCLHWMGLRRLLDPLLPMPHPVRTPGNSFTSGVRISSQLTDRPSSQLRVPPDAAGLGLVGLASTPAESVSRLQGTLVSETNFPSSSSSFTDWQTPCNTPLPSTLSDQPTTSATSPSARSTWGQLTSRADLASSFGTHQDLPGLYTCTLVCALLNSGLTLPSAVVWLNSGSCSPVPTFLGHFCFLLTLANGPLCCLVVLVTHVTTTTITTTTTRTCRCACPPSLRCLMSQRESCDSDSLETTTSNDWSPSRRMLTLVQPISDLAIRGLLRVELFAKSKPPLHTNASDIC